MKITHYFMLFMTFLFISCTNNPNETEFINSDELVILKVNSNSSKAELSSIQKELKESKNIDIEFNQSVFDKEGMLVKLDMKIKTPEGHSGHVTAPKIALMKADHGFKRDYSQNTKSPFSIGSIGE